MASRRAVGASVAAAIIFSSILLSNFILVSGEQQRFHLVSVEAEERSLYNEAVILESSSVVALLDATQGVISSRTFGCLDESAELASIVSAEAVQASLSGVSVTARLHPGPPGALQDDFPGVQPFNGTSAGDMDFRASTSLLGSTPDSTATLRLNESHVVSLPVHVSSLVGMCLRAYSTVVSTLMGLGGQICNSTVLGGAIASLAALLGDSAALDGFSLALWYEISGGAGCAVNFGVRLSQGQIPGPAGTFNFSVEESGWLS